MTIGVFVDGQDRPATVFGCVAAPSTPGTAATRCTSGSSQGGTFTPVLWDLPVGHRMRMIGPKGKFMLEPEDDRTHLFVSSGTGNAPFISMMRQALADGGPRRAVFLNGVSHVRDLGYRDILEGWEASGEYPVRYIPTVSRPNEPSNADWMGRTGRVETIVAPIVEELGLRPDDTIAYLCGNPDMIQSRRGDPPRAGLRRRTPSRRSSTGRRARSRAGPRAPTWRPRSMPPRRTPTSRAVRPRRSARPPTPRRRSGHRARGPRSRLPARGCRGPSRHGSRRREARLTASDRRRRDQVAQAALGISAARHAASPGGQVARRPARSGWTIGRTCLDSAWTERDVERLDRKCPARAPGADRDHRRAESIGAMTSQSAGHHPLADEVELVVQRTTDRSVALTIVVTRAAQRDEGGEDPAGVACVVEQDIVERERRRVRRRAGRDEALHDDEPKLAIPMPDVPPKQRRPERAVGSAAARTRRRTRGEAGDPTGSSSSAIDGRTASPRRAIAPCRSLQRPRVVEPREHRRDGELVARLHRVEGGTPDGDVIVDEKSSGRRPVPRVQRFERSGRAAPDRGVGRRRMRCARPPPGAAERVRRPMPQGPPAPPGGPRCRGSSTSEASSAVVRGDDILASRSRPSRAARGSVLTSSRTRDLLVLVCRPRVRHRRPARDVDAARPPAPDRRPDTGGSPTTSRRGTPPW